MKKLISLILSLVLVLSMSITAFAAEAADNNTAVVKGSYTASDGGIVYSVDVAWGSMEFDYEVPAGVWNEQTHSYESGAAKWTYAAGANAVKVTNSSNAAVTVNVTTNILLSGITASVEGGSFTLGSAAENATTEIEGQATDSTAYITLSGTLTDKTASKMVIGTVTVSIKDETAAALTEEEINTAVAALKNGETVTLSNVSAENHAAIVAALDEGSEGALISRSGAGLSTTYMLKETFAEALSEWSDGTTLTLLGIVTEHQNNIEVTDKKVTLDLNGKTLGLSSSSNKSIIVNESVAGSTHLTIRDSGTGGTVTAYLISLDIEGGTATLESGTLNSMVRCVGGTFIMTGGTVNNRTNGIENYGGTVWISGGEISATLTGIWNEATTHISGNPSIAGKVALLNYGTMFVSGNPTFAEGNKADFEVYAPVTLNTQPAEGEKWSVSVPSDVAEDIIFAVPGEGVTLDIDRFEYVNLYFYYSYKLIKNDDGSLALVKQ